MTAATDTPATLHPHTLGEGVDNSAPQETVQLTPEQQRIAALEAQLAENNAAAAEREQRYLQTLDSMMTRNAAPVTEPTTPAPVAFSLDDLPDAIQAPTEFKTRLAGKVNEYVANSMQSAQQQLMGQMTRAQALDGLWNRFNADPQRAELGKRTALLQGAAAVTFNEMRARGIDPVTVAAQNPDSIIGAIVTRMNAELGTTATPGGAAPASGARAATVAAGSAGAAPTTPAPVKPPTFVDQHKAAQRALGIV